jgi:sec-independent protein translocase protein TatB
MLSIPHMIVVFIVVLVVFGPQKLPELARGLGKLMAEFRKASTDFKSAFEEEMRDLERQAREVERRKIEAAAAASSAVSAPAEPATQGTPSGDETQPSSPELAAGESDSRATEAGAMEPVVEPVGDAVPRSTESPSGADAAESAKPDEHWHTASSPETPHGQ